MTSGKDKFAKMKELSALRESGRQRISTDIKSLRDNLSPHSLLNRFKYNARIEAKHKTKEAVALAKSKPGATAVVGGLALAAILWTPAKILYKNYKQRGKLSSQDAVTQEYDDDGDDNRQS